MSTDAVHRGACLCGKVRFEIAGEFEAFFLCHCSYCRKDTGSAHGANLFSSTAAIRWVSGESSVTTFNLPATRHAKSFCSVCGSPLPRLEANGWLCVPAGSLDTDVTLRPNAHIFTASRANWDRLLVDVPEIEGSPD
jgi:hypothetical protein